MSYKSIKSQVGRLCTIVLMIVGFPATSRRGPPTSRRHFCPSLQRRDVDLHVATSNLYVSVTSRRGIPTSRRQFLHFSVTLRRRFTRCHVDWYKSLSRRDVAPNVVTLFGHVLCHVATLTCTSRRCLVYSL